MSQEPPSRAAVTEQARDARERLERKRVRSRQAGNVEGDPSYYDERLAIEQLRNRLLHMKMMNEKNDPEKPKWSVALLFSSTSLTPPFPSSDGPSRLHCLIFYIL